MYYNFDYISTGNKQKVVYAFEIKFTNEHIPDNAEERHTVHEPKPSAVAINLRLTATGCP